MEPKQNMEIDYVNTSPEVPSRSNLATIGFILSIVFPIAGLIVSIVALRKIKKQSLRGKGLAIAGMIIGSILTVLNLLVIAFFGFLFLVLGGAHGNDAQDVSKPFLRQVEKIGGKKICDNGDSGYGIDNRMPWYTVYYKIPDSPNLTNNIKELAAQSGYTLEVDTESIKSLKDDSLYYNPGAEEYNPKSDYLIAKNGNKTLDLTINRQTSVALDCNFDNVEEYGRKQPTGKDDAIVVIEFSLPEVNR